MYSIPSLERRVRSLHLLCLSQYYSHLCCHSWTRIMLKFYSSLMISTRSVANCEPHPICMLCMEGFPREPQILRVLPLVHSGLNNVVSSGIALKLSPKINFSPGVCISFYKECTAAAPGGGYIHILLPCRL